MSKRTRPTFNPEFRLKAAQLVVNQGRSIREAADAVGVGKSTMYKWVRQLRSERDGNSPQGTPMTPDQRRIRELEKQLRRVEEEKEVLKPAKSLTLIAAVTNIGPSAHINCRASRLNCIARSERPLRKAMALPTPELLQQSLRPKARISVVTVQVG
ncbi:MAG: transposase [Pseudomonadales bacterium]|nr:transposase [Pseudomonadales bacterium]